MTTYYFEGTVYEGVSPVIRYIRAYNESTWEFIGQTTSSGDGSFYLETTYSGAHVLICLDDAIGFDYNHLVYKGVIPQSV